MITISHPDPPGSRGGEGADIHMDANGNLALAAGLDSLVQRCLQRLRFFRGEWFLAANAGVPYFEQILTRPVGAGLASVILTEEVRRVEEVDGVEDVSAEIDPGTRRMAWRGTVRSRYGSARVGQTT